MGGTYHIPKPMREHFAIQAGRNKQNAGSQVDDAYDRNVTSLALSWFHN